MDQIAAKKDRVKKDKVDQMVIDKQRIDYLLTKEYQEEAFEKMKRKKEKEFMSSVLKRQCELNSETKVKTRLQEIKNYEQKNKHNRIDKYQQEMENEFLGRIAEERHEQILNSKMVLSQDAGKKNGSGRSSTLETDIDQDVRKQLVKDQMKLEYDV